MNSNRNTWATRSRLPNGNTFIGWGSEPYFTEYGPSGKRLLEARFPGNDLSYRTMREPWVGEPLTDPAGAARQAGGSTTVYASWNGATEVASWRVLASSRAPAQGAGSGDGSGSGRTPPRARARPDDRRGERRQVRVRDGDPGAGGLPRASRCRRSTRPAG